MLVSQFPNGGWPQVFPLEGGYHDTNTFNDEALINVITTLQDIAENKPDYAFVPPAMRARAAASVQRGIGCILACQIKVGNTRTSWGQQHDALTLESASARNYEMPSQSGSESAATVTFLMSLPNPSPEVVASVHAAAAWLKKVAIHDASWSPAPDKSGRTLLKSPGAGTVWARYYEIGTDRPLFGDRDKSIHDDVNEISKERRNGYAWYGTGPNRVLEHYEKWAKLHPAAKA
jgi:PelA/Pel-15E family pectate lyase